MTSGTTTLAQLSGDYVMDIAHTRLGFVARHAMVTKVRGSFDDFDGKFHIDADPAKSTVSVTIKAASITTRNEQRDAHLKSNDFLAMDEHPEITFNSTGIEIVDDATVQVAGELTIRGTSKPVSFELEYTGSATDPFGNFRVGFEGSLVINRKDWGVNWNAALEAGGVLVSDKVTLEFDVSAIRQG